MAKISHKGPFTLRKRRATRHTPALKLPFICLLFLFYCLIHYGNPLYAGEVHYLEGNGLQVLFDASQEGVARELVRFYPEVREELRRIFGWDLTRSPSVRLIRDSGQFQQMVDSPLTVAFALPQEDLVVMDIAGMKAHPFGLRNTFKHELCHLLLHQNIPSDLIPRWLDEGIAQWVSDGAGDILLDRKRSMLSRVALRGYLIPLKSLSRGFPQDDRDLTLAYEESKDFIDHLIGLSGPAGLLRLLGYMKQGTDVEESLVRVYGSSLSALEREWQQSLRNRLTWLTYLSYHLYEILFLLAALMSIYGSIRIMIKKRRRMKEELEIEES